MINIILEHNNTVRAVWNSKLLIIVAILLFLLFHYVAPEHSQMKLVFWKLFLAFISSACGYITCRVLFPEVSVSRSWGDKDGTKFLGACILRGTIMSAYVIGCLLGI